MQHVGALAQQRFDLVGHFGGRPQANRGPLGQRIGTVDALAIAAAFGLDADLPATAEIGGIVDAVAVRGHG